MYNHKTFTSVSTNRKLYPGRRETVLTVLIASFSDSGMRKSPMGFPVPPLQKKTNSSSGEHPSVGLPRKIRAFMLEHSVHRGDNHYL